MNGVKVGANLASCPITERVDPLTPLSRASAGAERIVYLGSPIPFLHNKEGDNIIRAGTAQTKVHSVAAIQEQAQAIHLGLYVGYLHVLTKHCQLIEAAGNIQFVNDAVDRCPVTWEAVAAGRAEPMVLTNNKAASSNWAAELV